MGDYQQALAQYQELRKGQDAAEPDLDLNVAVCMFYLGLYEEAQQLMADAPHTPLKQRLLFHLAHKLGDDQQWAELLEQILEPTPSVEQQLSLASMHYMRAHYQEAIDVYKRVLVDNKDFLAINVYLALCFYKLDYYDMSQEVLEVYLSQHSDSTIAINLKACNRFRLFSGRVAEQVIKNIADNGTFGADLIRHNMVVFRNGEGALRVMPGLLNIVPEARLNLAIYYLKQGNIQEAHALMKEVQPTSPHEYILKGVVHAALGQQLGSVGGRQYHMYFRNSYSYTLNAEGAHKDGTAKPAPSGQLSHRMRYHSGTSEHGIGILSVRTVRGGTCLYELHTQLLRQR